MIHNTKVSIIAAMDEKRGIGKDGKIPWYLKEDLVRLKSLTKDHVVILGRKTYDSMVFYYNRTGRPMPGKLYIVVTHDKEYKPTRDNAVIAQSLEEAIKKACSFCHSEFISESPASRQAFLQPNEMPKQVRHDNECEVFIIGGGQIFQQALPLADKLYLTIVEGDHNCDTFFPDYLEFKKVIHEESKEGEGLKYRFLEVERS